MEVFVARAKKYQKPIHKQRIKYPWTPHLAYSEHSSELLIEEAPSSKLCPELQKAFRDKDAKSRKPPAPCHARESPCVDRVPKTSSNRAIAAVDVKPSHLRHRPSRVEPSRYRESYAQLSAPLSSVVCAFAVCADCRSVDSTDSSVPSHSWSEINKRDSAHLKSS